MEEIMKILAPEVPTIKKYQQLAGELKEPEVIESLTVGGSIGWFGSITAKKVLGYIPGGGLVHYASPIQVKMAYEVYTARKKLDDDTALAILSYDVCTKGPYPAQVNQAVRFIEYLTKDRKTEDVDLFGESAGGTLIIASLLHFKHPHPKVDPIAFSDGEKLGRILLLSPSGPVFTDAASFTENADKDGLKPEMVKHLWSVIEANHDPEVQLENSWLAPALQLEESWYEDLPAGDISIVWGEWEVLRDDIAKVAAVIKDKHQSQVTLEAIPAAVHCHFIMDKLMGLPPSAYSLAITRWASTK